jgi:hypothetical protein
MGARLLFAQRRIRTTSLRPIAFLAVAAAHTALVSALWMMRGGSAPALRKDTTTVFLLLPSPRPEDKSAPAERARVSERAPEGDGNRASESRCGAARFKGERE